MMQGSDSFRLIVRRGPQPNQSYELNKDIVTLGRDITNDIVIMWRHDYLGRPTHSASAR